MTPEVLKEYKKLRILHQHIGNNGEPYTFRVSASTALDIARRKIEITSEWDTLNPMYVRLRWEPDDCWTIDDLAGDCYDPKVNSDIRPSILERQYKEFVELVDRESVWGMIGEYYDGEQWREADSIWGIIGQDNSTGYELDIMAATIEAYQNTQHCPCCGRPIKTDN